MRSGCSGAIFFTGSVVRAIGDFDVRFGLGAAYGASEDADYMPRALALDFAGVYRLVEIVVEHPYKTNRPAEYFVGNVAVLAKHGRGRVGTRLLLARRLLGGVLLALRSQLPLAHLCRAVDASVALLFAHRSVGGAMQPASHRCEARVPVTPTSAGTTAFAATISCAVDLVVRYEISRFHPPARATVMRMPSSSSGCTRTPSAWSKLR